MFFCRLILWPFGSLIRSAVTLPTSGLADETNPCVDNRKVTTAHAINVKLFFLIISFISCWKKVKVLGEMLL